MPFHLRPGTLPSDYTHMAAILNASRRLQTTPAELARDRSRWPAGSISHLIMANDLAGQVIGFAEAHRFPNTVEGKFYANVAVHPASRNRGAGSALLDAIEQFVSGHGANRIVGDVPDTEASSLAFMKKRGYTVQRHSFDSTLDLRDFDETPFASALVTAKVRGIHFFTLADAPDRLEELYNLYAATMVDVPGYEAKSFMSLQTWRQAIIDGEGARPDWVVIAADADRLVGVTQIIASQEHVYTNHTLVKREYRGRGIALALKLLTIRAAIRQGAPFMRTGNDSLNHPMLAVNRKLGYTPLVGEYTVARRL